MPVPGRVPKTLLFILFIGPGPLIGLVPWMLSGWHVQAPIAWWRWLGLVLAALGSVPLFESIARFVRVGKGTPAPWGPTDTLVVSGLYRWVRNPMYVGVLAMIFGQAMFFANASIAIYGLCAWMGFHLFVVLHEEPVLRKRYGEEYERYARHVRRWVPRAP